MATCRRFSRFSELVCDCTLSAFAATGTFRRMDAMDALSLMDKWDCGIVAGNRLQDHVESTVCKVPGKE
jgi:hypothetical protein